MFWFILMYCVTENGICFRSLMFCIQENHRWAKPKSAKSWRRCIALLPMSSSLSDSERTSEVARALDSLLFMIPWTSPRSSNPNTDLPGTVCMKNKSRPENNARKERTEWRRSEVPRRAKLELLKRRYNLKIFYFLHLSSLIIIAFVYVFLFWFFLFFFKFKLLCY